MSLELTIDSRELQRALLAGPHVLEKHLDRAIGRTVQEMARSARRHAPKAVSTLVNTIKPEQPSALEGRVVVGVDYARAVEEGTAGGRFPPVDNILDWVKVTRQVPDDPSLSPDDLAFVIARSIARRGTPPQPYLAPALEENRSRAERRISQAIDDALRELNA